MNNITLRPCAFCGSKNLEIEQQDEIIIAIVCKECGAKSPNKSPNETDDGKLQPDTVTILWNTRK